MEIREKLSIAEVEPFLLALPLSDKNIPIGLFGPRGIGKTSIVETSAQKMATLYNTPTVLITWNFGGSTAESNLFEYATPKEINGKTFAPIEVSFKDVQVNIYHPDGKIEKANLYDLLPQANTYFKDKYVIFFLDDFTKMHPHEQGKFLEFFTHLKMGSYNFKDLTKNTFVIIAGNYKTESDYIYDSLEFIQDRMKVFSLYTTQEIVLNLAKEKNWHPALIHFLEYEKINVTNHKEDNYISPRMIEAVSVELYRMDSMFKLSHELNYEELKLSDKQILHNIAGVVKGTEDEDLKITLKDKASVEKFKLSKVFKAYYDAYRFNTDLIKAIHEEGRIPDTIYRTIEKDIENEKNLRGYALKNILGTVIANKIKNLPPLNGTMEEKARFVELMNKATLYIDQNMPKEEFEKAYPLFRKYVDEAIKDYREEYEKVAGILIQLFGLDEKRMGERYIKDFDSRVKIYYDEKTLKVTEIQTLRGEKIKDKAYKLENGEIVRIGEEIPQRLKDIKATVENYALSQLTVVYGLKKLGEKIKEDANLDDNLKPLQERGALLGAFVEFALAIVYSDRYGRKIDEIAAVKTKDEEVNITKSGPKSKGKEMEM